MIKEEHRMNKCPKCGKEIEAEVAFCPYCGIDVKNYKPDEGDPPDDVKTKVLVDETELSTMLKEMVKEEIEPLLKPATFAPTIHIGGKEHDKAVNEFGWKTKRVDAYGDSVMRKPDWFEKRKAANDWIRAVHTGNRQKITELHEKGLIEGTDSLGGFLVPDEFKAEIVYFFEKHGIARRMCRMFPMSSDTLRIGRATGTVSGTWTGEAAAKTESTPALGQVELQAKEYSGYTIFSNAFLADAAVDLVGWCSEQYANDFLKAEDTQLFSGTGNPFQGILINTNVNTVNMTGHTFAEILIDELLGLEDAVASQYEDGAAWFMHKKALFYLSMLKEATTGAYILDRSASESRRKTMLGYDVHKTSVLPSSTAVSTEWVVYGNLKYAFFGDREKMTADMFDQATFGTVKLAQTNQKALRVTERVAINVAVPEAFATLKTAAS